jgi:hypothetical protein
MKKFIFYNLMFVALFSIILLLDLFLSNTVLKQDHCYNYSEFYYELKKNCTGKYRFKKSFPLTNTYTDEMGLRVGKNKIKKEKNKDNIFIFGDSFTFGVGLEFEKTFAGLMALNLKEYNIYNFAVGSYSPSVHLFKLKKAISSGLIPKKIFVFLDLTDVSDEATRWSYSKNQNQATLSTNRIFKESLNQKNNFKKNNFKLLTNISTYINYNMRNIRNQISSSLKNDYKIKTNIQGNFTYTKLDELDSRFWKKGTFNEGISSIKNNFNEIKKISIENNFDVNLVIYPWAETLEFGQEIFDWSDFARSLCDFKNCRTIDSIPEFSNYKNKNKSWSTDLYFLNDEHFNIQGAYLLYKTVIKKM